MALIFYNRGVGEIERGEFAAAARSNLKALQLDAEQNSARRNLLAAWNNWAVQCYKEGDVIKADQLLNDVRLVAPDHVQD